MERSHERTNQTEDEDRLSGLTDDILLSILGRIDICTAVKAGMLSTRWRHLPWLLPELNIDVLDFVHCQPHERTKTLLDKAMTSLSNATSNSLAVSKDKRTIKRLYLVFYLTNNHMCDLGRLIHEAIEDGKVRNVELFIVTYDHFMRCSDDNMIQYGKRLACFLGASPSLFCCLTKLNVQNICFDELDIQHLLSNCEQLHHLILTNCDTGYGSILKIDFPNSKLNVLEIGCCGFGRVELICLPKLERLNLYSWTPTNLPLAFDFVPCLEEICLKDARVASDQDLKLSEILGKTTSIKTLAMDFRGERIWIQPERRELYAAFRKLRKLFIHGIFVEFSLLWTIALLEAAPSLQMLAIEVWDHSCEENNGDRESYPERINSWETFKFDGSKHDQLKKIKLKGFREEQMEFIRAIMEQAICLEMVVLEDKIPCDQCDALNDLNKEDVVKSRFPKSMDRQYSIVNELKDGLSSSAKIIFQ